jgi:GntR family transcriptional regulator / MocR family aminotransferase
LRIDDLDLDGSGARVDELADQGAAVLTPAHQFPLGMALAAQRRNQAVAWARSSGGLLVEDDYDGEFRYDRAALGAMQALAPDQVAFAGTASKSLAPGLRLSWLVVPPAWLDDVVEAKRLADRFTGVFDQLALADLIDSGGYDRHIRRCRLVYRRRRDRLVAALARRAPDVTVAGLAAGLHALLELPARLLEVDAVRGAGARGLAVEGLSAYAVAPSETRSALVVGYATPPEHAFTTALARLCAALAA